MGVFPHVVSVFNSWEDDDLIPHVNVTILHGVLLQIAKGANIVKTGLVNADTATMFIPFNVDARDPNGNRRQYVPPKEYASATDKSNLWTLDEGGQSNSTATYFAKGEITEAKKLQELTATHDYVYDVSTVDVYDFGDDMAHWRVGGK